MAAAKTKKQTAAKRSAAAKKAAATRKRNKAKGSPSKSARKQPELKQAVARHPFAPGTDVGVYLDAAIAGTRGDPAPDPLSEATVAKDGSLEVSVPKRGTYVVSGLVGTADDNEEYRRVSVSV